ncbi:metal ABC transporter substrate-binding protein [Demequina sp. NBRC 110051]|uniref:metal ABC transporter substrate-binding protein n=1 Tax=Demequina sp. NBRC 110051 TaxID=1570340 RepID=UPI0009FE9D4E|nr:metal ABC transporter substrate-binding protein [Demequina sp. NBRC 110051]
MNVSRPLIVGGAVGTLLLAGCSADPSTATDDDASASDASLSVGAAFYPVQFVAEQVGGDDVAVTPLIAGGVEPHDAELSPATVREMQSMDTVLYLSDFSAAVDDAIATTGARALDAHHIIDEHGEEVAVHEAETHDGEEHAVDDGHEHGVADPHFWLDPTLLAEYAQDVVAEFSELDPDNAAAYEERGNALVASLTDLDETFTEGLAVCERREIFVSHEAYGYLGLRYDLAQEGMSGLDPEAEPSPARLREIRDLIEDSGATTIFTESKVSAAVAESLASDAGVTTAVLDPVETATNGDDYIDIMTRNLEALRTGLDCS